MPAPANRLIDYVRRIAALVEAGLQGLAATKVKAGAALAFLLCTLIAGTGLIARQNSLGPPQRGSAQVQSRPTSVETAPAHLDGLGDPLPAGAVARMGTLRFRHWMPLGDV